MKHLFSIPILAVLFCLPLDAVVASQKTLGFGSMLFGSEEKISKIQDIEGTDYKLSHKYTLHFFIAGIYVSDDGYVLQKKTDYKAYYPLDEQKIRELQQAGALPSPLPAYSIPIPAYLFGYSLWIVLVFVVGIPLLKPLIRRLRGKRDCPHCGLQLTPRELETKFCGACSTPFERV